MNMSYTLIVRKSQLQYVAICLEVNVSACGNTLAEVEANLKAALDLYTEEVQAQPETQVAPIAITDFIEFLQDTQPEWMPALPATSMLRPFEVHEVPVYA